MLLHSDATKASCNSALTTNGLTTFDTYGSKLRALRFVIAKHGIAVFILSPTTASLGLACMYRHGTLAHALTT